MIKTTALNTFASSLYAVPRNTVGLGNIGRTKSLNRNHICNVYIAL